MENEKVTQPNKSDWFLRFIKGMFIGSGFILPGVSGGALAAVLWLVSYSCGRAPACLELWIKTSLLG